MVFPDQRLLRLGFEKDFHPAIPAAEKVKQAFLPETSVGQMTKKDKNDGDWMKIDKRTIL